MLSGTFQRCRWAVEVAKMAAFAARMLRIPPMHAFIEADASSVAAIALRAKLSEPVSKCSWHGMQHVYMRACMILRHDRVLQHISKFYASYVVYSLPERCSIFRAGQGVGRSASTYT
jgi:hypothetical protein